MSWNRPISTEEPHMNTAQHVSLSIKTICGMCLLAALLSGCSTPNRIPAWVENPKTVYPEARYLSAVGEGDTRRAAENAAAANLSRIFEAHIESDERVLDQIHEDRKSIDRTTDFTSDISILSSQKLHNLRHAETWRNDQGRYYAIAYLDRPETAVIYRDRIGELVSQTEFFINTARKTDGILKKYGLLRSALRLAAESDRLIQQLKVIHAPSAAGFIPEYPVRQIETTLADTARQIKVQIRIDGDMADRMRQIAEQLITRYGFVIGEPAVLNLNGQISIQPTGETAHGLVFVRYELDLRLSDLNDNVILALNEKGREAHKTMEQARVRAVRTIENRVPAAAAERLDAYFDLLTDQP